MRGYSSSYHDFYQYYWTRGVKTIVTITGVAFGIQVLCHVLGWNINDYLALIPARVFLSGWVWQLLTSAFLHSVYDPFHILFNMLTLYFFGGMIERYLGTRRFVIFYLACAVFASLVYSTTQLFLFPHIPMLGASGAVMGALMLAACLYPNDVVFFAMLFPIRLRTLIWFLIGLNLYMALVTPYNQVAATAHLGGLLFGYLYYRLGDRIYDRLEHLGVQIARRQEQQQQYRQDNLRQEVDRLLDKISQQGITSLTPKERELLQKASKEYQGRL